MYKLVVFLLPCGVWLAWLAVNVVFGKLPSKHDLRVTISLLLLFYFLVVSGSGIFWVAKQELPVFDWHYLGGYFLLLFVFIHVALHWKTVSRFLARRAPAILTTDRQTFKTAIRVAGSLLLVGAISTALFFAGGSYFSRKVTFEFLPRPMGPDQTGSLPSSSQSAGVDGFDSTKVLVDGKRSSVAEFYHESSFPGRDVLAGLTIKTQPDTFKSYADAKQIELTLPSKEESAGSVLAAEKIWLAGTRSIQKATITLETLAKLLFYTDGITSSRTGGNNSRALRTAPSAGALFPVNIYVLAQDVRGVPKGLYYYHSFQNRLFLIRQGDLTQEIAKLTGSPALISQSSATIIFTATIERTAYKYNTRSYRYINIDIGHTYYNLALTAIAEGLAAPAVVRFDDRKVSRVLQINPEKEALLILAPLGKATRQRSTDAPVGPTFKPTPFAPKNRLTIDFFHLIQQATSLTLTTDGHHAPPAPVRPASQSRLTDPTFLLPRPRVGKDLLTAIRSRRSVRNYSNAPIAQDELAGLCLGALKKRERGQDPFLSLLPRLNLYLVVRDVRGLQPGVYRYHEQERTLEQIRSGDFTDQVVTAAGGQEFVRHADVVFFQTSTWPTMLSNDGDRGYRYANIAAGIRGQRLYLEATALELGVCGVGYFSDTIAAKLIGTDIAKEPVLFLTAVGK